jgi:CheY-like chemotaxis protein
MRERADLMGSELQIESRQGEGTRILLLSPNQSASIGRMKVKEENVARAQTADAPAVETTAEDAAKERRTGRDRRAQSEKTRIVIVDTHTLFRRGVRNILDLEPDMTVVGEAGSGREAIAVVEELTPDVVLMDLTLPAPNGIETTQRIKRELPHTGVIVLASGDDEDQLFDAIKAGAAAYVLKDIDPTDLVAIIRRVRSGEYLINDKVFSRPAVASRVLKEFP